MILVKTQEKISGDFLRYKVEKQLRKPFLVYARSGNYRADYLKSHSGKKKMTLRVSQDL